MIPLLISTFTLGAIGAQGSVPMKQEERNFEIFAKYKTNGLKLSQAIEELVNTYSPGTFQEDIQQIIEKEKKEQNGDYISHWPSGQIKVQGSFKNDLAEGHFHGYYEDGSDAFKGFFKEGIKQGVHLAFFAPGNTRCEGNSLGLVLVFNEKGKLHGDQIMDHASSYIAAIATYKNGVLKKLHTCKDPDGERISPETFYEHYQTKYVESSKPYEFNR